MADESFTVGVEEEFFLVDAETGALRPRAEQVFATASQRLGADVQMELSLSQIEVSTPVCSDLNSLGEHLHRLRAEVAAAAGQHGTAVLPLGTHPFSEWLGQQITPKPAYERLDADYGQLAWEQQVSGCHVHVGVSDPELAIAVSDRIRVWLPTLRAIGTNSPFWQGVDTGYASYRAQIFDRWPTTGIPPLLGGLAAYRELVDVLISSGAVDEAARIYWDVRPSSRYATLEFRVADVCQTVDEAVMIAALARALVRTAVRDFEAGLPAPQPYPELLRAARWRASRYGLSAELIDLHGRRLVSAETALEALLDHVAADLRAHDEEAVAELVRTACKRGTGARRQRQAFARRAQHQDVVTAAWLRA